MQVLSSTIFFPIPNQFSCRSETIQLQRLDSNVIGNNVLRECASKVAQSCVLPTNPAQGDPDLGHQGASEGQPALQPVPSSCSTQKIFQSCNASSGPEPRASSVSGEPSPSPPQANAFVIFQLKIAELEQEMSNSSKYSFYAVAITNKEVLRQCAECKKTLAKWLSAGDREIRALLDRGVVRLVTADEMYSDPSIEVIPSIVVQTIKDNENPVRYKSRLVACGNFSPKVSDESTYSSTVEATVWRLLLVLHCWARGAVVGVDVCEAFTQATKQEEVPASTRRTFLRLPSQWKNMLLPQSLADHGVSPETYQNFLLEILKKIYGERGAPLAWFETLRKFLIDELKFIQITYDEQTFMRKSKIDPDIYLYITVFVDDLWGFVELLANHELLEVFEAIRQKFRTTDLTWLCGNPANPERWIEGGEPLIYTSQEISLIEKGGKHLLVLSQQGYLVKMLDKLRKDHDFQPVRSLGPYFAYGFLTEEHSSNPLLSTADLKKLRSAVNSISYAAQVCRGDLQAPLGQVSRCQSEQLGRARALSAVRHLLGYVESTVSLSNTFDLGHSRSQDPRRLRDFCICINGDFDANLGNSGGQCEGRRLQPDGFARHGVVTKVYVGPAIDPAAMRAGSFPLRTKSSMQKTVSLSTCEAELGGACFAGKEVLGTQNVASELFPQMSVLTPYLWGDNVSANLIASCSAGLRAVRHLDLANLWIRQKVSSGNLFVRWIPSRENCADILTKVLGIQLAAPLLALMGYRDRP